ncbi:MAG: RelA/SpoT family protein, partial [Burkholderiales bacterium]
MTAQSRQATGGTQSDAWLASAQTRFAGAEHALLARAAELAKSQFGERLMPTGESYLNHAREVAGILVGMSLDAESIAAGLLAALPAIRADAVAHVRENLSAGVSQLVEGVAAMAHIQSLRGQVDSAAKPEERSSQLEILRKMLLAMVQDIRVVLIKLADQTQQLRYLVGRGDVSQRKLAGRDAADLFAPLANRLGVWQLKWELEDLAFRCADPDTYKRIARELDEKRTDRESFIAQVTQVLRDELKAHGIEAEVTGRPKHIYSIYKKMQRKDLALKDLFDVRGVRILVGDIKDCYAALGLVHSLWTPLPKEFDDYIAKPKPNNYQSLHTAVAGPDGKVLEVQIRTQEMHQHGELGVAAHWRYKEGASKAGRGKGFDDKIAWLRQILDWREGLLNVSDLAQHFRQELFNDTVYVLTPQGRVVDLPKGSTPVDFAYHLHTELGHRCRGAKVDGAIAPLVYALSNGQTVEIIAAKVGGPSRDWLNPELHFVASGRARS